MKKIILACILPIFILSACASPTTDAGSGPGTGGTADPLPVRAGDAPLYMTTMTHMEGGFNDDKVQAVFEQHIQQLAFGMDLADQGILTWATQKQVYEACVEWNR